MEIVAILLIPTLLKYVTNINDVTTTNNNGQEELVQPPTDLIQIVMDKILEDVRCSLRFDDFWLLAFCCICICVMIYFRSSSRKYLPWCLFLMMISVCLPVCISLSLYTFASISRLTTYFDPFLIRPPVILHQGS